MSATGALSRCYWPVLAFHLTIVIQGGQSSVKALAGSTEEEQFQ